LLAGHCPVPNGSRFCGSIPDRKSNPSCADRLKPCASGDLNSVGVEETVAHRLRSYRSHNDTDAASITLHNSTFGCDGPSRRAPHTRGSRRRQPLRPCKGAHNTSATSSQQQLASPNYRAYEGADIVAVRLPQSSFLSTTDKNFPYSATCTRGQSCTNLSSSTAMPSLSAATSVLRRRHVTTPVSLPSHSSRRYVSASAGPL
jgi:hypothetical protein